MVAVNFTKLKSIWEELSNFRPTCSCGKCTYGGVKELNNYHNNEYAMAFLMGLNESFTHTRGHVLLMDPMPPINKVFAFLSQEEKQRSLGVNSVTSFDSSLAMMTKGDSRSVSTHCKGFVHTVDKCYKLHGFPPGYKPQKKSQATITNALVFEERQNNRSSK